MLFKSRKKNFFNGFVGIAAGIFVIVIFVVIPVITHADPEGDLRALLLARIAFLRAQLAILQAQLTSLQGINQTGVLPGSFRFSSNLTVGSRGLEVIALQTWLISKGFLVLPPGTDKGFFGTLTKNAVAAWQASVNLSPAVGFFGPLSREKLNSILSAPSATAPQTPTNLSVSCSPSVSQIAKGSLVTWNSNISGPGTTHTYNWQGTDSLSGTGPSVPKIYNTTGVKSASLSVDGKPATSCTGTVNVTEGQQPPIIGTGPTPGQWPAQGLSSSPIYAFGYQDQNYTYLTRMRWLVDTGSMSNIPEAISLVNSMPEGRRAFTSLNAHEILNTHNQDNCVGPESAPGGGSTGGTTSGGTGGVGDGGDDSVSEPLAPNPGSGTGTGGTGTGGGSTPTPYHCPWWDHGVDVVRQKFSNFAQAFRAAGGKIDYLILDSEQYLSNWAITSEAQAQAIQNDPRFPALRSQMQGTFNFGPSGINVPNNIFRWGQNATPQPDAKDNYLKWNAFMRGREASYVESAVFNPIRSQFPSVKGSDYEYHYYNQTYQVPDFNGHRVHAYGSGAIIGTHQNTSLYGRLNQISSNPANSPQPGYHYVADAFNAFKYDTNSMRAMRLSSSAPISAWFSERSWAGDSGSPAYYRNSDYYAENILHAGLITKDPDFFILWNRGAVGNVSDDQLFERILAEFNQTAGWSGRQPIVNGLVSWDSNIIYTGSQVGNFKIWRFTPRLNAGQNITQVTTNSGSGDFTAPVVFTTNGKTVTFPQAFVYKPTNPVSVSGAWVIQKASAPGPTLALERRSSFLAAVFEAIGEFFGNLWAAIFGR